MPLVNVTKVIGKFLTRYFVNSGPEDLGLLSPADPPGGLLQRIVQRVSVDRLLRDAADSSSLTQNLIQITRPSRH